MYGNRRLQSAGFVMQHDEATGIALWVRPPEKRRGMGGGGGEEEGGGRGKGNGEGNGDVERGEGEANTSSEEADDAERHNPIVFLHGLGIGLAPYADYVAALPRDRPVVAPEWPNISYGADKGHRYPTPRELAVKLYKFNPVYPWLESAWFQPLSLKSENNLFQAFAFKCNVYRYMADFLQRATRLASENAYAAGPDTRAATSSAASTTSNGNEKREEENTRRRRAAARPVKCDVIAHSYGTVILTYFRRHHPELVRRCVYIDPGGAVQVESSLPIA
jgi:pimeloyl-ACP methyl ester carboxylesterase